MKGWLLIETLLVLLVAIAIVWLVVALPSSLANPHPWQCNQTFLEHHSPLTDPLPPDMIAKSYTCL